MDMSIFVEQENRPDERILDRLEKLTGLTFHEYRLIEFEDMAARFEVALASVDAERDAKDEMEITGRSFEDVLKGWREIVNHYRSEIERLRRGSSDSTSAA